MADSDQEFSHESLQDRDSIVRYLSALGEGLQQGKLLLACNGQSFTLDTPALVKFDVEAKQKRNRAQLTLKMSWKRSDGGKQLRVEPLTIGPADDDPEA